MQAEAKTIPGNRPAARVRGPQRVATGVRHGPPLVCAADFEVRRTKPPDPAAIEGLGLRADAAGSRSAETIEDRTAAWKRRRREEADALWGRFFADRTEANRNSLIVHYLPFVRAIAERLKAKLPENVELGDLISTGTMGLLDAIVKFDPALGVRFETYCMSRVKGSILDFIRLNDWVPRLIRTRGHERDRAIAALTARLRREPTPQEVARAMGMAIEEYRKLLKQLDVRAQISMDGCVSDGRHEHDRETLRLEMLEDPHKHDPSYEAFLREFREMAPRGLNESERIVLERYYFKHHTMKEIGDSLSLSESRVCQIHVQLLAFLKNKFRALAVERGFMNGADAATDGEFA